MTSTIKAGQMEIMVFGLGYVGSITTVCLAKSGYRVTGVDVIKSKVEAMREGRASIYEPGLTDLLQELKRDSTSGLQFCLESDVERLGDVSLICVGSPSLPSGAVDLFQVESTVEKISLLMKNSESYHHLIVRSTVPPGTTEGKLIPLAERISQKKCGKDFDISFYPEFLREGHAIDDFFNPGMNVLGQTGEIKKDHLVAKIFPGVQSGKIEMTGIREAEMLKYANNSFHALKVCFVNEIGTLSKSMGVDSERLMDLFCKDRVLNISDYYLKPGFSYGGSCLPKELRSLNYLASTNRIRNPLLSAIGLSNFEHTNRLIDILSSINAKKILFSGLTFKPNTDDVRESPLIYVVESLLKAPSYKDSFRISVFDHTSVLEKISSIFRGKVNCMDSFKASEDDAIVLGPKKLESDEILQLENCNGTVIDLLWHRLPRSISEKTNYISIC